MLLLGVLITRVLAHSSLGATDARVVAQLAAHRTATVNRLAHHGTYLTETTTISVLAAALFVVLRLTLRRWRESVFLGVAVAGEVAIFLVVTLVIHRHRPAAPELDSAPPTSSFPSGHTAVVLYVGLAVPAWRSPHRPSTIRSLLRAGATLLAILIPLGVSFLPDLPRDALPDRHPWRRTAQHLLAERDGRPAAAPRRPSRSMARPASPSSST